MMAQVHASYEELWPVLVVREVSTGEPPEDVYDLPEEVLQRYKAAREELRAVSKTIETLLGCRPISGREV
jgi:hypothetical protein